EVDRPLLEMFFFDRLIVDEFHQYTASETASLRALRADKRWGLSGTPALDDLYDVAQLAGLVGLPLRVGSDLKGVMKAGNVRSLRNEQTDFERFDSMRVMPSSSIHARLCETHQLFLDTFVRRNLMDFAELRVEDYIHPVALDLDHRAMYTELSQHLNSLDMRIRRGKKGEQVDREERLYRAVNTSETGEEALSKTAAFVDREALAGSGLESAIRTRVDEVAEVEHDLRDAIAAAKHGAADGFGKWKLSCLTAGGLEDQKTIASVITLAANTKAAPARAPIDVDDSDEDSDAPKKKSKETKASSEKRLVSRVNTLSKRLVVAHRSLRYLHAVQALQRHATSKVGQHSSASCESTHCMRTSQPGGDVAVSAYCGHIICRECHDSLSQRHSSQCPAAECTCAMKPYHLLWTSRMGDMHREQPTPFGAKLEKAVSILDGIRKTKDQAIFFVQYGDQLQEVERALEACKVPALIVKDAGKAAAQIKLFQERPEQTVLVLNASDETAAGLNLQNANHVIFLSPLLRDSQYGYEATMAQAIGRIRRHGQKKQIFVHRIVALDTIDVDILEHRERRIEASVEPGATTLTAPKTADVPRDASGKLKRERAQLVKVDGSFSMQPHSWLQGGVGVDGEARVRGKSCVAGWEDFSSQLKFSRAYTEDDD
ncbi:hypothetical protein LTR53_014363, partial [Teratosphaeriaceae sp. CCFEE 6253]